MKINKTIKKKIEGIGGFRKEKTGNFGSFEVDLN